MGDQAVMIFQPTRGLSVHEPEEFPKSFLNLNREPFFE